MNLLRLLGRRDPRATAGQALYVAAARQARTPDFYTRYGVADTPEGRFELYALHVALLFGRLKGRGPAAAEAAQEVFDAFTRSLDDALRELGVGDVVVGKRMRGLVAAAYGRARVMEGALEQLPDATPLQAVLSRTVFEGREGADAAPLADYVARARAGLAAQSDETLLSGVADWAEVEV